MKVESLRKSYTKLLQTFDDCGVKLNESQKECIDTFIVAVESKLESRTKAAIKSTQKIVTEKLEKQYREVFESLMDNIQKNQELSSKIQKKVTKINESKKMAKNVDQYLNLYLESVLPKKEIVNYGRMQKLMTIFESLKDTLLVNEESIEAKKAELTESFDNKKKELETQMAKMQVKLNESMNKNIEFAKKLDHLKAVELLESKTADLPVYEATQIKKRLAKASAVEVEKNFSKILESIQNEAKDEEDKEEPTLEAEINNILDKKNVDEDDELTKRPHNGNGVHNGHIVEDETEDDEKVTEADDAEDKEVTETENDLDDDDDSIGESIDASLMRAWIERV